MKLNFWKQFFLGVVLTLVFGGMANADIITLDLTLDAGPGSTGAVLDNNVLLTTLAATPLTADVIETDVIGTGASQVGIVPGLTLSIVGGTGDALAEVNGSGTGLGVNSDSASDNSTRYDVDFSESLSFQFNQDITLLNVHLVSFSGQEQFTVGSETFQSSNGTDPVLPASDGSDIFTFASGGQFIPANTPFIVEAGGPAGTSVGLEGFTIETISVPEPSSIALLGLLGLGAVARRRR